MLYTLSRWTLRTVLSALFHVRVGGLDNLPQPPYILAANHLSWVDPLILACWLPHRVTWIGAEEYSVRLPVVGRLLARLGVVLPIRRGNVVRASLTKDVVTLLNAGNVVGIFPEGRVGRCEAVVQPLKKGVAHFAARAEVPIVCVAIHGTSDLYLRRRIRAVVQDPVWVGRDDTPAWTLTSVQVRLIDGVRALAFEPVRQPRWRVWRWLGRVVR